MSSATAVASRRMAVTVMGALAGASGWALTEIADDLSDQPRLFLALCTTAFAVFWVMLLSVGPLSPRRAGVAGLIVALPMTVLVPTASFRFEEVDAFFQTVTPGVVIFLLVTLPLPYLIGGLGPGRRWLHYTALFDEAWQIVVRGIAALFFVGFAWALILLSDALLKIVGLDIIEDVIDIEAVPWIVSGLTAGLALAVIHEMSDFISPRVPIRLLRLLAPPTLVVAAVFLLALPLQGMSNLFGELSAAATLMGMAVAAATLVSSVLDRDDDEAATGLLSRTAFVLALLMPVMAALAVLAVVQRVAQYGWTPDRLAAMCGAALLSGYGIGYVGSILAGRGWKARIRRVNAVMALAAIAVAALWLSPILDPQRISADSQVRRFAEGKVDAAGLDLWTLDRDWGVAGKAAIAWLSSLDHPEADILEERLAALAAASSKFEFEAEAPAQVTADMIADFTARVVVLPKGAVLPDGILASVAANALENWLKGCDLTTPAGNRGCVAVVADLVPDEPGEEVVLFVMLSKSYVQVQPLFQSDRGGPGSFIPNHTMAGDLATFLRVDTLDRLVGGDLGIVPKQLNVLEIDGAELVVLP